MKKLIALLLATLALWGSAQAAEEGPEWDKFPVDRTTDMASLQNGAKLFVNYCLNCHSAAYMRYNRLKDIGLTDEQIKGNLMFASEKVGETMKVSLDPRQAKDWFGATPPDLTVIARSRAGHGGTGSDYLYTYLRSYYRDNARPTGWNNTVFPNVGMPNVLWELQGQRVTKFADEKDPHEEGRTVHRLVGFEQVTPGKLTPQEYDRAVADLVAYLTWMGEPAQHHRVRVGVWVLIFLAFVFVIAWRLNAAYWKDVK